jgi:acyl-CoA synthetase (AMP-forming)/AMP-acid ligase II
MATAYREREQWPSIPAMTAAAAEEYGDTIAVAGGNRNLSYRELHEAAGRFGAALVGWGLTPGERVAIWSFNSPEWIVAALGTLSAGGVLVPVNTRFKGAEAADILSRSRARVLVTTTDFLGTDYVAMLDAAEPGPPDLETIVVAHGKAPPNTANTANTANAVSWHDFHRRETNGARAEVDRRSAALGPDDVADIIFTSGTTGVAKGVVQTHAGTLRVATDWVAMTGMAPGDRYLMVNPYFHMFGLKAGILACIASGVTMLPQPVFDVDRVLSRVAGEQVTVLPGPPTLYQSILDHPERTSYDLSSLRIAVTGAADIPVELIRRVRAELPFQTIFTGYGLTEGGTATATSPDDDPETVATTVGRPRPGFELRIVDGRGDDLPPGETGEIQLRSTSIMLQYLDDPQATRDALSPDGWLRTGDLGVLTEAGCLRIVGRSKDMFIVGGFNAYPAEIENLLLRHPYIQQAAVIGIPDDRLGEVGMAFVVPRPGATGATGATSATISGDDVIQWSRGQMANYKVPRMVEIVDELPLNATGKVMKDVLRRQVTA